MPRLNIVPRACVAVVVVRMAYTIEERADAYTGGGEPLALPSIDYRRLTIDDLLLTIDC